jgi:hypothetical protein
VHRLLTAAVDAAFTSHALLSVADPSANATSRLVNGTFPLSTTTP